MEKLPIVSERLKELRLKLEMSQSEFSKSISLKPQTYSAYEKNINLPPVVVLARIAEKYGVSLDWLCGFSNSEEKTVRLDTYADILKLIFELGSLDGASIDSGFCLINPNIVCGYESDYQNFAMIRFDDTVINETILNWKHMLDLLNHKTIDRDLYDLWCKKILGQLSIPYTADRGVVTESDDSHEYPYI